MLSPNVALGTVGRKQNARIVDDRPHRSTRRRRTALAAIRDRADSSSACVNAPCSDSHSATAARPSRTRNARRAAAVIHADTLVPSASAASTTLACTSASTVTANLTAGFPLGMAKQYYRSRIVARA
jgi:hypothetical protein